MKIAVILTGGTAGCEVEGVIAHLPDPDPVREIFLGQAGEDQLSFFQPFSRFSEDVGPEEWLAIAAGIRSVADSHDGAIVVHGTDTMAYSAGAAALLTRDLDFPVVFTGSMLPSKGPDSDLPGNIDCALGAARSLPRGCYLAFQGGLHRAAQCRKDLSHPSCFTSLDRPLDYSAEPLIPGEQALFAENVLQLRLYPGAPLDLMTDLALSSSGVVIELYASGTAPSLPGYSLVELVKSLSEKSIPVCLTRPWAGSDFDYPAWPRLLEAGGLDIGDCFTEFATVKLMWALSQEADTAILMQTPFCGELDSGRIIDRSGLVLKSFFPQKQI